MTKKNKRFFLLGMLCLFSAIILAVGLKYFPYTKLVKIPSGSEKEFVDPGKIINRTPNTLYYDFEIAPGKEMPGGFYKGIAHSGQYSVKAYGQNSYSTTVERTAAEVGIENLKAVAISAWIYVFPTKNEVKGSLVFTASNEVGVNVCWEGIGIVEPEVPRGKWFKVSKYFDLTKVNFKPDYKIQVYFWNNSNTEILVDDYFISFGGPVDRRGDSARVDMTKPEGYVPRFNYPPFHVNLMAKEPLAKSINPAEIGSGDLVIAGNFLGSGTDALVVIRQDGNLSTYAFCPDRREFLKLSTVNVTLLKPITPVKKILKGKFLNGKQEQFIVVGEKGWLLAGFDPIQNLCAGSSAPISLKLFSKTGPAGMNLVAGDFNGDQRTELVSVGGDGQWQMMSLQTSLNQENSWNIIASAKEQSGTEWDQKQNVVTFSAGRFIPEISSDMLLAVTQSKQDHKVAYTLQRFNPAAKRWDPWFKEKSGYLGKTIGLDTLKPSDQFLALTSREGGTTFLRYNRDWRFDLKEIRFNDSTFDIRSNVDFIGYDADQNPKYYETLNLLSGHFLDQPNGSLLLVGHVAKNHHYQATLPDFVHLYSFPVIKK